MDTISPDEAPEPTTFEAFLMRLKALSEPSITHIQDIFCEAVRHLRRAEMSALEDETRKHFDIPQRVIAEATKEARNYCAGHGFLNNVSDIADAYIAWLDGTYEQVVWVGSNLYVYASPPPSLEECGEDNDYGFFEAVTMQAIEEHLLTTFAGVPAIDRKSTRNEVLTKLRLHYSDTEFFRDATPGINVMNGFLCLDGDGQLRLMPHDACYKARFKIDTDFQREADFSWLEIAFARTLPDRASLDALQEVAGGILFNVEPHSDHARRMALFKGPKSSGKSTFITLMSQLFPPAVVGSVPPDKWGDEKYRARLENLRLNAVTELSSKLVIQSEWLKMIVSREPITARRLYQDPTTFIPDSWHLCATNTLPRINDKTDAFARRLLVFNFARSLDEAEVDSEFLERVRANPSAFIIWAAAGAARLIRNGRFTLPAGHRQAAAEMQCADDYARLFALTEIGRQPGGRISTTELREALIGFATERGIDPRAINDGTIRRVAGFVQADYGATRRKRNGNPFYEGVTLTSQPRPEVLKDTDLSNM